jgi:BirA family transcriptional regulator, biotin operon repressor / biotin---[acetyl-CoA-carboxylase] ligase
MPTDSAIVQGPDIRAIDGWTVHEFAEVTSTNSLAAHLPAWTAVRATVQTAGRGRTGRSWVSDENGLWLSAVLPTPGDSARWSLLPLAAGWAALSVIRDIGLSNARLRWPNDIMVDRRKLAGILVDRFSADTAVVGIGLNVANRPDRVDSALSGETVRLADLVPETPDPASLLVHLLVAMTREHHRLESGDASGLCRDLGNAWLHRHVRVTLAGGVGAIDGQLQGIDPTGALLLRDAGGDVHVLPAHRVNLLREIFPN